MARSLKARIRDAMNALRGREDYIASTVREWEQQNQRGLMVAQSDFGKLARRFVKHVKVCASRNASGIACIPIRVVRKAGKSSFKSRRLGRKERKSIVSRFDLIARKTYGDEMDMEEIIDPMHPMVALMANANPRDNGYDMIEQLQLGMELTGNGYLLAIPGPNKWPVELWVMQPQFVRVVPDVARFISSYVYGRSLEIEEHYPVEQITHIKFPNPTGDPYYGMGPLASCVDDHDLSMRFTLLAHSMIDNGVQPGGVLTVKGKDQKQRKEIETNINQRFAGADKYGRVMVVSDGVEWQQFNPGEKEMAFLQGARDVRETIANAFDIPLELVAMSSAKLSTPNTNPAIQLWQLMALRPRIMRMQSKFNEQLVPLFRAALGDDSLCYIFDECVDEDEAQDVTEQVSLYNAKLVTKNEARAELGLDPVDGGDDFAPDAAPAFGASTLPADTGGDAGDMVDMPTKVYVVDRAAPVASKVHRMPGESYSDCVSRGIKLMMDEGKPHNQAVAMAIEMCKRSKSSFSPSTAAGGVRASLAAYYFAPHVCCNKPSRAAKAVDHGIVVATEEQLTAALRSWFGQLTGQVSSSIGPEGSIGVDLSPTGPLGTQLESALSPAISHSFERGMTLGAGESGMPGEVRFLRSETQDYLRGHTIILRDSIMQTSEAQIRSEIDKGLQAGESPSEIADRVRETLPTATDARADMIATTETSRALNMGRLDAWKQQGITTKRWLLSGNPCPVCRALAVKFNTGIAIGEAFLPTGASLETEGGGIFTNDYLPVETPPVHPNCRCDITFLPEGA